MVHEPENVTAALRLRSHISDGRVDTVHAPRFAHLDVAGLLVVRRYRRQQSPATKNTGARSGFRGYTRLFGTTWVLRTINAHVYACASLASSAFRGYRIWVNICRYTVSGMHHKTSLPTPLLSSTCYHRCGSRAPHVPTSPWRQHVSALSLYFHRQVYR